MSQRDSGIYAAQAWHLNKANNDTNGSFSWDALQLIIFGDVVPQDRFVRLQKYYGASARYTHE